MNHITNYGRIVSEIPKPLKRKFAAALKDDKLTITEAVKRMVMLYVEGKVKIAEKGRFDL